MGTAGMLVYDYARNAALLAVLMFGYAELRHRLTAAPPWTRQGFDAVFFGLLTIAAMSMSIKLGGVVVNFRSFVVALAVLFGGPIAGLAAAASGLAARAALGGANAPAGLWLLVLAYGVALTYRHVLARRRTALRYRDLAICGIALDLCRIGIWIFEFGFRFTLQSLDAAWLGVLVLLPLAFFLLGCVVLLTEQRHALARSIADSEARFRHVIDQLPYSLTLVNRSDRYTYVNAAHARFSGVAAAEQIGETRQAMWNRMQAGTAPSDRVAQVLATGEPVLSDPTRMRVQDRLVWAMATFFPVRNAEGAVTEIGTANVDVTAMMEARETLAAHELALQRYSAALMLALQHSQIENQPLGTPLAKLTEIAGNAIEVERTGVFRFEIEANEVVRLALWIRSSGTRLPRGITSEPPFWAETGLMEHEDVMACEDVESDPRMCALLPELRARRIGAMLAAPIFALGRFRGIVIFSHTEGTRRWTADEISFARSIADLAAIIILNDRHREALAALDLIEDGIYVSQDDGRTIFANRVALAMAGRHNDVGALNLPIRSFPLTFPRPLRALEGERDSQEMTIDLGTGHQDIQILRHRLPNGGVITLIRDLTQQNTARRERQRLEHQLMQASKLEAIGQLSAGIAHDFNNLLGAIMGFARFLKEDLPETSEQHQFATRILAACERGKAIVTQIMSFARTRDVERHPIDLAAMLRDNRGVLTGLVNDSTVLTIDLRDESLPVLAHEGQLTQLLVNLCANANDALQGRPGTIRIEAMRVAGTEQQAEEESRQLPLFPDRPWRRRILGEFDPKREYAAIRVTDTGTGIPLRALARIFEPFYTSKRHTGGTGLGLAVVHSIVGAHDGILCVESIEGSGTTFSVYFPLIAADALGQPARSDGMRGAGTERILIVDDDVDMADMLSVGLTRLGYEVAVSNDPLEALAAFREEPGGWDIAVLDRMMPELDGIQLAAEMKRIRNDLAVIMYTGLDDGAIEDAPEADLLSAFLVKPVSPNEIGEAIRRIFDA